MTNFDFWTEPAATASQTRPAIHSAEQSSVMANAGRDGRPPRERFRSPLSRFLAGAISIAEWPFEFILNDVLGFEIGERRGHGQPVCEICGVDVHDVDELCPLQRIGDCSTCGATVDLDRWGNCIPAGDRWRLHVISNRRKKCSASAASAADSYREISTEEVITGT